MKFKYIATAILALSSLFACKQMVEDVPGSTPTVKIDRPTLNVPAAASDLMVTFEANVDWTATCDVDWIQFDPKSGTRATQTMTLSVAENTVEETPRSGKITIRVEGGEPA